MGPSKENSRGGSLSWAVGLALFALWAAWMLSRYWNAWAIDASALYFAARFAAMGQPEHIYAAMPAVFTAEVAPAWAAELARLGHDGQVVPYVYPPIWAYLLAPIAERVDLLTFFNGIRVAAILSFGLSVVAAYLVMRPKFRPATYIVLAVGLCFMSQPFTFGFFLGQPQLVVMALVLWSMVALRRGAPGLAGVLLGLAAAIKISPILFCLLFLIERQWRAAAIAVLTAGAVAVLSLVSAGPDLHFAFFAQTGKINALVPLTGNNITFEAMAHQLFSPLADVRHPESRHVSLNDPVIALLSPLLLLLSVALCLWATRATPRPLAIRLLLLSILLPFFSPLAWSHYYVPVFLLVAGLWGVLPPLRAALIAGILIGAFNLPLFAVLQPLVVLYLFVTGSALLLVAALVIVFVRNPPAGKEGRPNPVQG